MHIRNSRRSLRHRGSRQGDADAAAGRLSDQSRVVSAVRAKPGGIAGGARTLIGGKRDYPALKSDQNSLALQSQFEGTENRIAVARRDYIGTVQAYNTTLRTIPGRWVAAVLYQDARTKETFTISEQAQQAPQVKFCGGLMARAAPRHDPRCCRHSPPAGRQRHAGRRTGIPGSNRPRRGFGRHPVTVGARTAHPDAGGAGAVPPVSRASSSP